MRDIILKINDEKYYYPDDNILILPKKFQTAPVLVIEYIKRNDHIENFKGLLSIENIPIEWNNIQWKNPQYDNVYNYNTHFPHDITNLFAEWDGNYIPNLNNADLSNTIICKGVFQNTNNMENIDISNWNVSNVIDMSYMFEQSDFNNIISSWDVSNVTNMDYMFASSNFKQDISEWNVDKITEKPQGFDLNTTGWKESYKPWETITPVFPDDTTVYKIKHILNNPIKTASSSTYQLSTSYALVGDEKIPFTSEESYKGKILNIEDNTEYYLIIPDTTEVFTQEGCIEIVQMRPSTKSHLIKIGSKWNPYKLTAQLNCVGNTLNGLFANSKFAIEGIENIIIPSNIKRLSQIFYDSAFIDPILLDLSKWNVSNIETIERLITKSKNATINVTGWDTSNVWDLTRLFEYYDGGCIGLNSWKTPVLENMSSTFCGTTKLGTDEFLFDASNWDDSNIKELSSAFYQCPNYNGKGLSSWTLPKLGEMVKTHTSLPSGLSGTFSRTPITEDISNWNTSKVRSMADLFGWTLFSRFTLNIDISKWDVSNVTNMDNMFYQTTFGENFGDISKWDVSNVLSLNSTFYNVIFMAYKGTLFNNLEKCTSFRRTFSNANFYGKEESLGLNLWNVKSGTNFNGTFINIMSNPDITLWEPISATDMNYMFKDARGFIRDISHWVTPSITTKPDNFDTNTNIAWTDEMKPRW